VDKFSKWIEAHPIANLRAEQAVSFFTDIVHRFGVPKFRQHRQWVPIYRQEVPGVLRHIPHPRGLATVAHPQTKGQVEGANGMILQGLKPRIFGRLNKSGRRWLQELLSVIWSLSTTPSMATGFTPFSLVYGAEAVLPTDLEYGSPRVKGYDEGTN
jgi:hypothetical protein